MEQINSCAGEFNHVEQAPPDPIYSLINAFKQDTDPNKVSLGIGAYRDDFGKPYIFPVVKQAEKLIVDDESLDKEYSSQEGLPEFNKGARGVLFGWDSPFVTDTRVTTAQSLSGTGALRVLAEFLYKFRPSTVYVSNPTWANHYQVFGSAGLQCRPYRYYNTETKGLDFEGLIEDLNNATPGSVVVLHTCAHNPTGCDPSLEQWKKIADVCKSNKLYPLFDTAYQGFVSGDLQKDAEGLKYFIDQGFELMVAQSFAKIMGLYGERVGALHIICKDAAIAGKVLSQIKIIVRSSMSSPPKHGARIAGMILNDPNMRQQWLQELVNVTKRIALMRQLLQKNIEDLGTKGTWNHITDQIGMFTYTGLTPKQCEMMIEKHHVYLMKSGRISVAGVTSGNVEHIAKAIKDVTDNY